MITGFTGSSRRISSAQQAAVVALMIEATELHHGDCVVADAWAHKCAVDLQRRVVVHPPDDPKKRAFCAREYPSDLVSELPTRPYLDRNHDIVDASERLVAVPDRAEEAGRAGGGVWATVRHARRRGLPIIIVDRDGHLIDDDVAAEPESEEEASPPQPEPETPAQPEPAVESLNEQARKPRKSRAKTQPVEEPQEGGEST